MLIIATHIGSIVDPELGAGAIVNASNPHAALGSGVSGAIADACGSDFQHEVHTRWKEVFGGPLEPHDCLVTSGGTSSAFDWVLHVPAVDYEQRDPETGRASGPTRVRNCTLSAFQQAARLIPGKRLGLPLLGAGHGGLGESASADAMIAAIREFGVQNPNTKLVVCFAVLNADSAERVRELAKKHEVPFLG